MISFELDEVEFPFQAMRVFSLDDAVVVEVRDNSEDDYDALEFSVYEDEDYAAGGEPIMSVTVPLMDILDMLFQRSEDAEDEALNEHIESELKNLPLTDAQRVHRGDQVRAYLGLGLPKSPK